MLGKRKSFHLVLHRFSSFYHEGRVCTGLEPIESTLQRLLRFGRSADEMHSRYAHIFLVAIVYNYGGLYPIAFFYIVGIKGRLRMNLAISLRMPKLCVR